MPKVSPLQSNFNGGEFSPEVRGRVDSERYRTALKSCLNYFPLIQGALTRRPGTKFVARTKTPTKKSRNLEFEFSTEQAYIIETGDQYFRFFRNNAQILETAQNITGVTQANPAVVTITGHGYSNGDEVYISGVVGMTELNGKNFLVANVTANTFELQDQDGNNIDSTSYTAYSSGGTAAKVYEISSPYLEADLFAIKITQSSDVLYLTHPSYAPRKLTRTGHTSWTLTEIDFLDGPFLTTNATSTTLALSGTSGSVTVTASATTGINGGDGFQSTDVGRLIRFRDPANNWTWLEITAYSSTTSVTATVRGANASAGTATTAWRLGVWSATSGYPAAVTFHEDRLSFAGPTDNPLRLDLSKSGDYENFEPTSAAGAVSDDNAMGFTLNGEKNNAIRWIKSDEKGLIAGTYGREWIIRPSSQSEAMTPTNITAKPSTSYGSSNVEPVSIGKGILFVQRSGKRARELNYFFDVDGFRATDLTILASHISGTGFAEIAYQKEPHSVAWCVRNDGVLAGMSYERDLDALRVGWHRHILGGTSDAAGSDAVVESVAVIPASDGSREEVWLSVKRYVNGSVVRHVEYMNKFFEDTDEQRDGYFVDCGLSYDAPVTISGATAADPVVITSTAHGFSDGDEVLISGISGMTNLNGNRYTVNNSTANTYELQENGTDVDGSAFSAYISGGEARKYVSTISGLDHLEGETVSICGDGAAQPDKTVSSGSITLETSATTVHVGYGYMSRGQMLRVEAGSAIGTALGKTRRTHRVGFLLHRSLGLSVGMSFDDLTPVIFSKTGPLGKTADLYSGIISTSINANYDYENEIAWEQSQPLPSTILAVMPQMVTQDR